MTAKLIKDVHIRCARCGTVFHPVFPRLPRTTDQWEKFVECAPATKCPRCKATLSCDRSNLAYTLVGGAAEATDFGIGAPQELHYGVPEVGN